MRVRIGLIVTIVASAPLIFMGLVWLLATVHFHLGGEAEFADRFKQIRLGETKARVLVLLGAPSNESKEFHLGQSEGHEAAYRRARLSGSTHYLVWHGDMDTVYTIGFDAQDKVTVVESGGT